MIGIIGIDEVGRGCLAGPLVAAAVCLNETITGLKDSKLLTRMQRERLAAEIELKAQTSLGWVSNAEIDEIGLTKAVSLAMRRALAGLEYEGKEIIIDGNFNYLPDVAGVKTVIKADQTVPAASAASILAKVARDNFMAALPAKYAAYEFASHVGYGTKRHLELLKALGACDLHRRSFAPIRILL